MINYESKTIKNMKRSLPLFIVVGMAAIVFITSVRVTMFRYRNYEYGKFDLGNMSQMVYNTLNGRFMEVTDYFGANMPRWGMSHVDPFLLVFVPFYAVFPDARILVVAQLFLLISSSFLLYLIGTRILNSKFASMFVALSFLFYPAVGYLLAWTGFHGVTSVVPFFLGAFLLLEDMYIKRLFTRNKVLLFFFLILLTMAGKEEISLIILAYAGFIFFFRGQRKIALLMGTISLLWFFITFFVLIPNASHYRIEGYQRFVQSIGVDIDAKKDVLKPNYFLSRYEEFGESYLEILKNMALDPGKVIKIFFSGDRKENFNMTFMPLLYLPVFYLPILLISSPEFLINYLTTQSGVGTAEIYNHRISMIIPILFISVLFSIKLFEDAYRVFLRKEPKKLSLFISILLLATNIYTSNLYQNPILLWFTQSLGRRFAFASGEVDEIKNYKEGERVKVNRLETKDWNCFDGVVSLVPSSATVTAPDYLGAHFSTRRVNALFPANFDTSDYVVVDVNSKKVLSILGVNLDLINKVVGHILRNPDYKLIYSCSNIFVFKKETSGPGERILPLQEDFDYVEKVNYSIGQSLYLSDFNLPQIIEKGKEFEVNFVYKKEGDASLNAYVIYTSFKSEDGKYIHQIANLPSFGVNPPLNWEEGVYYLEDNKFVLPDSSPSGNYNVFVGMTNNIKTYNIFLGKVFVR
ncbi:hypothetical protein A2716_03730 [candidate division WWE3 bacterium RIFCSPHIGHO2_01_FULL_40_23]|uniref:DUF2079 domain-containing protein n=1 Tax=candidate division WWE3 bacterium RIFCSPLOWO2_01_FULL_41_18 TaxID=1802625 RepID=A0A1F4VCY7_UNCKA|nr:MAG: hypothetical protein A2716_03730 [candidate division WWE3 bacterium RIFCSPHIGHO2_01_FULL_40_23]OGC54989.1 MAG: hypothetical protein A3A78_03340 [candidate division WWE3 bacterium RIFCSPLOWO2_01_FULL_41_18]